MSLLCKIGIHRPLRNYIHHFSDKVSGRCVYKAWCPCGIAWLTDSWLRYFGYRIRRDG